MADELLADHIAALSRLQEKLYAQDRWSVLLILQGMDAAGKDSAIKHVMSGVNPQGCEVHAFKSPSDEERDHDYLWRTTQHLPRRGHIGLFNRSYYEEVLIVRVHPELLARQQLPPTLITRSIWRDRYEDLVAHERYLARNGTVVVKVFLNVSKAEQRRRFLRRVEDPTRRWKLSVQDIEERKRWPEYQNAYEEMIRATSTAEAPWHVVPADRKWWARVVIGGILVQALRRIEPQFPDVTPEQKRSLARVARALRA
jgi:PPK2 family polyphosphate:nucleotide phosphotransferase